MAVASPLTFSKRPFWLGLDQPILLPLALALLPGGALLALLLLLHTVWRGRIAEALLGMVLLTLANPVLFSADPSGVGRWVVLLLALVLLTTRTVRSVAVSLLVALLGSYVLWQAAFISELPTLTLFKGGIFVMPLWLLFNSPKLDWRAFSAQLDTTIPLYLLLSLPTLAVPAIGFARNGLGFQGLTNQPQALGVLLATFGVWLFARLWGGHLTTRPWVAWGSLLTIGGLIVETQSRTALGGLLVGMFLVWLTSAFSPRRAIRNGLLLFTVAVGGILIWTQTTVIQDVIYKERIGGQREDLTQGAASRLDIAAISVQNFQNSPDIGIGFGMPSAVQEEELTKEPVFGLPIAANAEKGVWITAALEELGVAGFTMLVLMLIAFGLYALIWLNPIALAVLLSMLIVSLGENTLFSFGAMGMVQWLLFFAMLHAPAQRYTAPDQD